MDLSFLSTLKKYAITSTCMWRHNIIVEISKIQPLFESLGGPAVRASGFFGDNWAVVPWPSRFKSQPSRFFFTQSRDSETFPLKFWNKVRQSSMEKKCADFRWKKKWYGRGLNPWPTLPIARLRQERAPDLTTEPSVLWGGRCIYLISTCIFTLRSFLKEVNT